MEVKYTVQEINVPFVTEEFERTVQHDPEENVSLPDKNPSEIVSVWETVPSGDCSEQEVPASWS